MHTSRDTCFCAEPSGHGGQIISIVMGQYGFNIVKMQGWLLKKFGARKLNGSDASFALYARART